MSVFGSRSEVMCRRGRKSSTMLLLEEVCGISMVVTETARGNQLKEKKNELNWGHNEF